MDLTSAHLRYLTAIYQLSQLRPKVSSVDVAGALGVSRPSVARMLDILAERDLVIKARYGKITLTAQGAALARRQQDYVRRLAQKLPAMGLCLSEQEAEAAAQALAAALPSRCMEAL